MSGDRLVPDWAAGRIVFPGSVLAAIDAHVCGEYPNEGCGWATGPAADARVTTFVPTPNLQDRYHALDPVQYPRTARTAYLVHPLAFERAFAEAAAAGAPVKVIVHSHADHDATFSPEDVAFAIVDGLPTRDCAYLVVSVEDRVVRDRKLFALVRQGDAWTYAETALCVEDRD